MVEPEDPHLEGLKRLHERLEVLEAAQTRKPASFDMLEAKGSGAGYRMIAELVGGVLMGVGFGWLLDKFLHTSPWGLIGGLLIGAVGSIWLVVRSLSALGGSD
jgi:ATP synthase protein I